MLGSKASRISFTSFSLRATGLFPLLTKLVIPGVRLMNEYELSLLQQLSQNLDRSQRYTSRMILVKALENELNIKHN